MRSNHPRHVEIHLAVPADAAAGGRPGGPAGPGGRFALSPVAGIAVAGHEVVGQNGDEPLPGGVDDPAAHHPGGIAAKAHAHGQGLLAAGLGPLKGMIQDEGHPGEVAEVLQQGKQGKEDGHGGQHDAHHPGQHPVDTQNQGAVEPRRGV